MTQDPNNPYGGLLGDSFFTPSRMGLLGISQGLLQAGGPSATPVGFGDALGKGFSGGIQGMQQGAQLQKQDVMTRLQMEKLLREKKQQEALANLYAPSGNPMVPGPSSSVMAGSGETPATGAAPSGVRGPNLDQLGALAATGLKVDDHLKLWELRNPKVNFQNGIPVDERSGMPRSNVPTLPQTNQLGFSTRPTIGADGNISISVTPGSADAFRLQQDITEGAKAGYDLVSVPTVGGGTQLLPRSVAAQRLGGGSQAPQSPAMPQGAPRAPQVQPQGGFGYKKPEGQQSAQRAVDSKFADDYVSFATGGFSETQKQLQQLRAVSEALKNARPGSLTGPRVGVLPRSAMAVVNPDALTALESVEEVGQRNLRLVLGPQFTEKEGERLISRVYNPMLRESDNLKRVERLYTQIEEAAKAKLDASQYFQKHGTLDGWKGKLWTLKDFEPDGGKSKTTSNPLNESEMAELIRLRTQLGIKK
jgi:hypothetical protein